MSGALIGVRKNLDLLGVVVVGVSTGVGGGIIRDVLIGVNPPVTLVYLPNSLTAVVMSLLVFFFHPSFSKIKVFEIVSDAFGMGLFAANSTVAVLQTEHTLLTSITAGVITAIGGGMIRDMMVNEIPGVLTRELYAVSALLGAVVAATIFLLFNTVVIAVCVGVVFAITLRLVSYWRGWNLPLPRPSAPSPTSSE